MTTMTITSSVSGGERLPVFLPGFGFESITWPRILTVLVRGLDWFRLPGSAAAIGCC